MSDEELRKRLNDIERKASSKGHFWILVFLTILLLRGC